MLNSKPLTTHSWTDSAPPTRDIKVGELVLWMQNSVARLYTKTPTGQIIELGRGATSLAELFDVDLTEAEDGDILTLDTSTGKWRASSTFVNIADLAGLEISNPQENDYLQYDAVKAAFVNKQASYALAEISNIDVTDLIEKDDHVIYYDETSNSYKLRPRFNLINQLDDVTVTGAVNKDILTLEEDGVWRNMPFKVEYDLAPKLGGDLNASNNSIVNSSYKTIEIEVEDPVHDINYALADYWVVKGTAVDTLLNIQFPAPISSEPRSYHLLLEIRQSTGDVYLGGLANVKYEDGRLPRLSGNGRTDLLSVLCVQQADGTVTNYLTVAALNLSLEGQGGTANNRYDKNRFPPEQLFDVPSWYDDFFLYTNLLLNFEQSSLGRDWFEDKSLVYSPVTATAVQVPTDIFTFGQREFIALFETLSQSIDVAYTDDELTSNFTIEFFVQYPLDEDFTGEAIEHTYALSDDISIKYFADIASTQASRIEIALGSDVLIYRNAFRLFRYQNNRFVHVAVVRVGDVLKLYVDGIEEIPESTNTLGSIASLSLQNLTISLKGNLNSFRITNGVARYLQNFTVPNMRFGLLGGALEILENQVFDTYYNEGIQSVAQEMFA